MALSGSGGADGYGELIAWDLRSRQRQHVFFRGDGLAVNALACLYLDGTPLAVAGLANDSGGGELQIWNLQTRQLQETIAVPHAIGALAVTPGNELVVGAAQELLVFTFVSAGPTDSS